MARPPFLEALRQGVLLADGAMGTLLYSQGGDCSCFEALNLREPQRVLAAHQAYRQAGACLLETNTFAANRHQLGLSGLADAVAEVNRAGAALARQAAASQVGPCYVAGAVGPLGPAWYEREPPEQASAALFREQIAALVAGGVDLLLFETFARLDELLLALRVAREFALPRVAQMAFVAEGRTRDGLSAADIVRQLRPLADVVGTNCGCGPHDMLQRVREMAVVDDGLLSAFANSGFPQYVNGRHLYLATPDYFAARGGEMVAAGVRLIGGCCGTTPEHIAALNRTLQRPLPVRSVSSSVVPVTPVPTAAPVTSPLLERWAAGRQPITVELDPPRGLDCSAVLAGARRLAAAGVDAINLAENPLARIRMGNLALAARIQEASGVPVIAHVTCRDRNLIGLHSELMGAHLLGLRHILAVTGDPVAVGDAAGASNVFDLNAIGLLGLLAALNQGRTLLGSELGGHTAFCCGAAFNPNAQPLEGQLRKLERKVAAGARFVQTQPVYSAEVLQRLRELSGHCPVPLFVGLLPLVSERNAEFLHNEVPGIRLPDVVRQRMRGTQGDSGVAAGMAVMDELIGQMRGWVAGYYLMPPFGRVELAEELIHRIRAVA
ncbi:bifunctional homocysteine S-methyltransferase/methylenetetrahydrofolate reductase [Desulfuromonas thiophila]|uniref:bifunctional homocysteine S-methyltransferase/methylenetetrahydrofolate reductase n=1 Tax=Desulfuromonas thiophila TaxID=57664 RepID=UPI0029F5C087|nr:bifunctional homocysteine S-methyltransferase/methylenetetrahydrofolate reductase [Desulfuromonas thiophila]